jgi:Na+/H+-translocating membrane pyrophosphatase
MGVTMPISRETEAQKSRKKSNILLGAVLGGFVVLVFAITVVKMIGGANMEAYDHVRRPALETAQ